MAYPQAYGSAVRVQQFSSPAQKKCNSLPCGVAQNRSDGADAVASLNTIAKQVSDFHPTKVASTTVGAAPKDSPKPKAQGNLVVNGDFDSLGSWRNLWGLSTFWRSGAKVASKNGLRVARRQTYYAGPVQTLPLQVGITYRLISYASLATSKSARSTMRAALLLTSASGNLHVQSLATASIVNGQWSKLSKTFTVSGAYGKLNKIELLFYGPSGGHDFYLDEVVVKP
jgi:hypothetical protein